MMKHLMMLPIAKRRRSKTTKGKRCQLTKPLATPGQKHRTRPRDQRRDQDKEKRKRMLKGPSSRSLGRVGSNFVGGLCPEGFYRVEKELCGLGGRFDMLSPGSYSSCTCFQGASLLLDAFDSLMLLLRWSSVSLWREPWSNFLHVVGTKTVPEAVHSSSPGESREGDSQDVSCRWLSATSASYVFSHASLLGNFLCLAESCSA